MQNLIESAEVKDGEKVQLKGGICEVNFVYNVQKGSISELEFGYTKLSEIAG